MLRSRKPNAHNNAQNLQDTVLKLYEYLLRVENIIQRHMQNRDEDASVTSIDKAIAHYNETRLTIQGQINDAGFNSDNIRGTFLLMHQIVNRFYDYRNQMKPDQSTEEDISSALTEIEQKKQELLAESEYEERIRRAEERRVSKEVLFSSFFNPKSDFITSNSTSTSSGPQNNPH